MRNKEKHKASVKKWVKSHPEHLLAYREKRYKESFYTWQRLSYRAKARGIVFNLTREEFDIWFNKTKKECFYCEITFEQLQKSTDTMLKRFKKSFSIDRLSNNGAYEIQNIVFACQRCNFIKGDYFTWQEMKGIAEEYVKPKIKSL